MADTPIVYIIDDDEEVIDSLRWLIESVGYQVLTFTDPLKFLKEYNPQQANCIVLDVRMPGMSGLELQETLIARGIETPLIFITGHADVPMAVRAMKIGAAEFLSKPVNNQMLLETINKAIQTDTKNRNNKAKAEKILTRAQNLTPREQQVMELMVTGALNKNIATELGISVNTVELHRAKVMKKMQAKTLAELVGFAYSSGLATTE